jgi:hypothetical protein
MPVHTADVEFGIYDLPTLLFINHCFDHWRDDAVCTNAHVSFMKYLVRWVFGLPAYMRLVGVRFRDDTLAMMGPIGVNSQFFVISRGEAWKATRVWVDGFTPYWGLETGFWEGLTMGQQALVGVENTGPKGEEGD